jgi:hypothetical protein
VPALAVVDNESLAEMVTNLETSEIEAELQRVREALQHGSSGA